MVDEEVVVLLEAELSRNSVGNVANKSRKNQDLMYVIAILLRRGSTTPSAISIALTKLTRMSMKNRQSTMYSKA